MTKDRDALLIAVGVYQDPDLRELRSPKADAAALRLVLEDEAIGGFGVEVLVDQPSHLTRRAIQKFFSNRSLDDLLLVHVSSHGVKDDDGRLFFACADTELGLLDATAVPASYLNEQMERCRARSIVMLLDCCYSGAFASGSKSDRSPHLRDALGGSGRAILTASNALEYAWEGDELSGDPVGSTFTTAITAGLASGEADRNRDGLVSIDDLYDHVHEAALAGGRRQTPQKYLFGVSGSLVIADTPRRSEPLHLPEPVLRSIASPLVQRRLTAVGELEVLSFAGGDMATLARAALLDLQDDDSRQVSAAASEALERGGDLGPMTAPVRRTRSDDQADGILVGIEVVAAMVARTLGPEPRSVLIGEGLATTSTSDALDIVEGVEPEGRLAGVGSGLVKAVVREARGKYGDGAATAAVIFSTLSRGLQEAVLRGLSPTALRRSLESTLERSCAHLSSQSVAVETKEQLERGIATALDDPQIASAVVEAVDKVGKDGVIIVEESNRAGLSLVLTEGMRMEKGFISHYFVTDPQRNECLLEDVYVLIADQVISSLVELLPLLEKVMQSGKPLLILAHDVDGEALSTLVVNKIRGIFKSVAVAAPGFGDQRKVLLGDIAILTGGQVITQELGLRLESTDLDRLGRARKVIVSKDESIIIDTAGKEQQILGRINQVRTQIEATDDSYDRGRLQHRLASLAGGVAVLNVGGGSELAVREGMDIARRGVSLSRSMTTSGMSAGGASTLARTAEFLRRGVQASTGTTALATTDLAMATALEAPLRVLCANSGIAHTDAVVEQVGKLENGIAMNVVTGHLGADELWEPLEVQTGAVSAAAHGAAEFLTLL